MSRIERTFRTLRKQKKKAFIAFITAGYPSLSATKKLVCEFTRVGVDSIELGVPFSDPMADGPIIQKASQQALAKHTTLRSILKLVKEVRRLTDIPLCLMTYYNPIFCFGEEKFCRVAAASGVDGVIIPDLPPEEGKNFMAFARKAGIDTICFVSPTTSVKRMRYIAGVARGFIYYVSLAGVTGVRQKLPPDLARNLRRIKRITEKPVCVGFGISNRAQVRRITKISDGVIVGSAIVKKIIELNARPDMVVRVGRFVKGLLP